MNVFIHDRLYTELLEINQLTPWHTLNLGFLTKKFI